MTLPAAHLLEAAVFDVDGTLTKTSIVDYYVYFRRHRMSFWKGRFWHAAFLLRCAYFLLLDRIDRRLLNEAFYRGYAGITTSGIQDLIGRCHSDVIRPRLFPQALECIQTHKAAGRLIVCCSGSIDAFLEPLAAELRTDHLIAARLGCSEGRFTGRLVGPAVIGEEKARRLHELAMEKEIDLSRSYAYGDSFSDIPMLRLVGHPQVVNPDRALARHARASGWPIHRWGVNVSNNGRR